MVMEIMIVQYVILMISLVELISFIRTKFVCKKFKQSTNRVEVLNDQQHSALPLDSESSS
jgi:hypothetical protein